MLSSDSSEMTRPQSYATITGAFGIALLAGCASTGPIEPPKVTVSDVTIDYFTAADARFTVQVKLANPNWREISVQGMTAELRIEDVPIGTAKLAAPVRLPSRGEATASVVAGADLEPSLRASARIARRLAAEKPAAPFVRYAVSGTVTLEGGATLPFSRAGEFKLAVTAPAR
jgi:LEA14-like dessication related protein